MKDSLANAKRFKSRNGHRNYIKSKFNEFIAIRNIGESAMTDRNAQRIRNCKLVIQSQAEAIGTLNEAIYDFCNEHTIEDKIRNVGDFDNQLEEYYMDIDSWMLDFGQCNPISKFTPIDGSYKYSAARA